MNDITEYRLEIEWDRKINTGSYSRHKSIDEAIEELKEMTENDPADSFRIHKVRTITEEICLPNATDQQPHRSAASDLLVDSTTGKK